MGSVGTPEPESEPGHIHRHTYILWVEKPEPEQADDREMRVGTNIRPYAGISKKKKKKNSEDFPRRYVRTVEWRCG